jgi:hypothetical protein
MLNTLKKSVLLGVALSGWVLLGTAGTARADDWRERCDERISHEQRELDRADCASRLLQLAGRPRTPRAESFALPVRVPLARIGA